MSFTLAIVGRPNVGKSTLFNRLVGKKLAIVDDTPGVTRDRRAGYGNIADLKFDLIDTAGLEEGAPGSLSDRMRQQTRQAVDEADVALMLYDARHGVTPMDEHFAEWLRRTRTPVILCANKCESKAANTGIYEAYGLGLGDPIPLSAEHGEGLGELYQAVVDALRDQGIDPYAHEAEEAEQEEKKEFQGPVEGDLEYEFEDKEADEEEGRPLRLAIVGRPNAGKSTLINHLVGEDRLITGPEAGLTRDSISVDWEWEGLPVKLFDTAGMRKRARVNDKVEKLSVADGLRAVQFAEVVVLLIDAELGIERQDLKIAELVVREGRGLVIALNKWDVIDDRLKVIRQMKDTLTKSLPQLKGVKVVNFSALTGKGTQHLMPAVAEAYELWNARIPTAAFNQWLVDTLDKHPAPSVAGRRIKIRYGAQVKTRPPTFMLFCNRPDDLPDSYLRYLENELRKDFDLPGVPFRMVLKKGANPYESRRKKR
ncbi:ribosome biogenesis GTPase Der [Kordiimonas sp. SCSIO 12603]|uniref:ribosome biogenesis GTPase Der n=1 Tax=Kordiimonas sp. SCSIO 12603 TaxID=2829596 RepID=UPI002103BB6F|nr:ribosome biogenesis GTPase Der [Kordiimonas sp. SCSIO 12603]UTW57368.1 ribosome biogenesis GTPase Der [Kordiimonas sp. SCSIO 12603]